MTEKYNNKLYRGKKPIKFVLYDFIKKKLPIVIWIRSYDKLTAISDLIAGVTLGLTLVPQSIAYASLAGLPVQYGLYSAFIGTILYAFFGTVKEVSIGPTSLMALLTYGACKDLDVEHVILLTFLAGCVVLLMGLLRLGILVDLISASVTSGFTSATAVIVVAAQLKGILGLSFHSEKLISIVQLIIENRDKVVPADMLLSAFCITVLLSMRKLKDVNVKNQTLKQTLWFISIGRNAFIVLTTSIIAAFLKNQNFPKAWELSLSSDVKPGFPRISLPPFGYTKGNETITFLQMCHNLNSSIVLVPIIMVLANIAIAKAFASGFRIDASQEMFTLGLCNIIGSIFHSMPTTGAFTRSAVSNASGVKTPFAGIYSGIITLIALCFLTPYFNNIPKATLSSVLICAVIFMVDYQMFIKLWRQNKRECFMLVITFIVSILDSVETALFVGMLSNLSCLVYSWARPNTTVEIVKTSTGGQYVKIVPSVGLFYLNIDYLKSRIIKAATQEGESLFPIVIDCSRLQAIDYTACQGLEELSKKFENTHQKLIFFNASTDVVEKLQSLKSIDDKYLTSKTEAELLEIIFHAKEDFGKLEMMPLLAESFRKKESVCEYGVKYELSELTNGSQLKRQIHSTNEKNESVEKIDKTK